MRWSTCIAFQVLLALGASCAADDGERREPGEAARTEAAYIECKPIVALLEPMDSEDKVKKAQPAYGDAVRFRLAKVGKSTDELGNPAISIEVAESDEARFVEWSKLQGNRSVAFFFDGDLLTTLIVGPVGQGEVVLCGAPQPWSEAYVSRLVERMRPSQ